MRSLALGAVLFAAACGGDNQIIEVSLGGTVGGLHGAGLVLVAGDQELAVSENGSFAFDTRIEQNTPYAVSIAAQPSGPTQHCNVLSAQGTTGDRDVTNVRVVCTTTPFSVGGTVTGLAGEGLTLRNGDEEIAIAADGTFEFTKPTLSGKAFEVTIGQQPTAPWQTCEIAGGSGTVVSGAVTSVVVNCATDRFTVGGTVSGLAGELRLQNGPDEVLITANGQYAFASTVASGNRYEVTISAQPASPSQTCVLSGSDGMIADANIDTISVACTTNAFAVGGTVSGLAGDGLVLQNNAGDDLPVAADGPFVFDTDVTSGQPYAVTVLTQPANPAQTCTVTDGGGSVGGAAIDGVSIVCETHKHSIGGQVEGLGAGESVDVLNNGAGAMTIAADGTFTFQAPVLDGQAYSVTAVNGPAGKTCSVTNGSGTATAAVTNVLVECSNLLMNTAPELDPGSFSDMRCDGAISTAIEATQNTTITRLDTIIDPTTATNVRFAIFGGSSLLFYSSSVAVVPGSGVQTVKSPSMSFAMTPGTRYHIAAMVDGCANFPWDAEASEQNGLKTFATNGNPEHFAAPTGPNECCGVDTAFKIYGTH